MSKQKGFTLIELLVVIGIIAILAAILFPMLTKVQEKGKQVRCMSNMRQLAISLSNYTQDANGALPRVWEGSWGVRTWRERIFPYLKSKKILDCACPTLTPGGSVTSKFSHYGMGVGLTHSGMSNPGFLSYPQGDGFGFAYINKVQRPSRTIMIAENRDGDWSGEPMTTYGGHWDSGPGAPGGFYPYHFRTSNKPDDYTGGGNFIFCDSHVRYMPINTAEGYDAVKGTRSFQLWIADQTYNLPPKNWP